MHPLTVLVCILIPTDIDSSDYPGVTVELCYPEVHTLDSVVHLCVSLYVLVRYIAQMGLNTLNCCATHTLACVLFQLLGCFLYEQ